MNENTNSDLVVVEMTRHDFETFWPTFQGIILAQETYAFDPDMSLKESYRIWCELPLKTLVVKQQEELLGTYYVKPNGAGPSKHICNCGYMVSEKARGKGIATLMCEHSQTLAVELGFTAMQFNSVISSNEVALMLWQKLVYRIIGTIPEAFDHPQKGYVDSYIMYKKLN